MPAPGKKPQTTPRKRILLVDDHELLRRGLKDLIETEPDLAVCAEADTRHAGLSAVKAAKPDLVIADLSLKDSDGLEMIKDIKRLAPRLPILVLSMHEESVYAERVLRAGALGYVTKQEMNATVLTAIRRTLAGEIYTSEAIRRQFTEHYIGGATLGKASGVHLLSDRELTVFKLIGRGKATGEIAQILGVSVKTIESHRERLKLKMKFSSGAELTRGAMLWIETGRLD